MIDKMYIQKLRELDIMKVADALGMGIRNKRALCIHHDDHHPSLAFNPRKNSCHCYSCGFSADTIGLVMERFQMNFLDACKWLANQFDVYIGDTEQYKSHNQLVTASQRRLDSIRSICAQRMVEHGHVDATCSRVDVEYFERLFAQMHLTESGERFLLEKRMLSPEVVERCHIVSTETKVCMGRVGQGTFDAPSLIFPYFNQEGKLVSVQSRYLGEEKEKSRFKFAPGSHRMVYGLERLKEYPKQEPLLITEGPSDCWTALTLGFHAIAIPSATLFDSHCQPLLERRNLHMFPDQDEAGFNLYFELKKSFPQLEYHQLPDGCKDLSEHYLQMRQHGKTLEEARTCFMKEVEAKCITI